VLLEVVGLAARREQRPALVELREVERDAGVAVSFWADTRAIFCRDTRFTSASPAASSVTRP
jgi:hypothetical protein